MASSPQRLFGKPPRPATSFNIKDVYEGPNPGSNSNNNDSASISLNMDDALGSSIATIQSTEQSNFMSPRKYNSGVSATKINGNSSLATLTTAATSTAGSFMTTPPVSGRYVTALQNSESTFGDGDLILQPLRNESVNSIQSVDLLGRSLQLEVRMPSTAPTTMSDETSITNDDDGDDDDDDDADRIELQQSELIQRSGSAVKRLSKWKTLELGDDGRPALQRRDNAMMNSKLYSSESRIQNIHDEQIDKPSSVKASSSWDVTQSNSQNQVQQTASQKRARPSKKQQAAAASGKQLRKLGAYLSAGSTSKKGSVATRSTGNSSVNSSSSKNKPASLSSLEGESPVTAASRPKKRIVVKTKGTVSRPPTSPSSKKNKHRRRLTSKPSPQVDLELPMSQAHDLIAASKRHGPSSSSQAMNRDTMVQEIDNLADEISYFFALFQNPPTRGSQLSDTIKLSQARVDGAKNRIEEYKRADDLEGPQEEQDHNEQLISLRDQLSVLKERLREVQQDRDEREAVLRQEVVTTKEELQQATEDQQLLSTRQILDLREELKQLRTQNHQLVASKEEVAIQLQEALTQQEAVTQSAKYDLREAQRNVIQHSNSSKLNAVTLQEELEQQKSEVESTKMELKEAQMNIIRHSIASKQNLQDARLEIETLQSNIDRTPPTPSPSEMLTLPSASSSERTPPTPMPSMMTAVPRSSESLDATKDLEELEKLRKTVRDLKRSRKQDAISYQAKLERIVEERETSEAKLKRQVEQQQVKLELARIEQEKAQSRMAVLEDALEATESSIRSEFEESISPYDAFSMSPNVKQARERSEYIKAAERAQHLYDEAQKSVSNLVAELGAAKENNQSLEDSLSKEKQLSASSRAELDMELAVCKGELENAKNELEEQRARAERLNERSQEMKYKIRYLEDEVSNSSFTALFSQFEGDNASFSALRSSYGDGGSTAGGNSVSTETVLQATLEELDHKVMTTANQLRQEREDFKKQSVEFNEALEDARRGKTALEIALEEAHASIAQLNEKRREELEHYESQIEEISSKSRSIASSLQSELRHWKQEAWSTRDALEEAEMRSRLMKKELDSLQTSKWELEVVRTKERKEMEAKIDAMQSAHKQRKEEFETELEETTVELELCQKALATATDRLQLIEEEGQERIVELENELTEARTSGRDRDVGGRQLRSRLAQQLRETNDRLEQYGKELQESKLKERDTKLALKDAKARIQYLEQYVEDSRAAILDMKRTNRVETEDLTTSITSLQQELETTKASLERELAASKLDASSKDDELAEARRLVVRLEEEINERKPLKQPRDSEEIAATQTESDAVYSSEETRRLIQNVKAEIQSHKARKLALAGTKAGNLTLTLTDSANVATEESKEAKLEIQTKVSFKSAMSGSVDTEAMKSFAEDSLGGKDRGTQDHSPKEDSIMSATLNSDTLKSSFSEDTMEEGVRATSPDPSSKAGSAMSGTVGSFSLKSSFEGGRPEPGSMYSGITGSSYTDDISLKNHVPHPIKESGSVTSGMSGCDSLHTSDDDRMFTD